MRIAAFSTSDGPGGAGLAALQLHRGFRQAGADAHLAVWEKSSPDRDVYRFCGPDVWSKIRFRFNVTLSSFLRAYLKSQPKSWFSNDVLSASPRRIVAFAKNADIIQLGWIDGFLNSALIRRLAETTGVPIVWTLMDQTPLTGGCNYTGDCRRFFEKCGHCPVIGSHRKFDITSWTLARKKRRLSGVPIGLVVASAQDEALARKSALFSLAPMSRIPVPVDAEIFRPVSFAAVREILDLPQDRKVLFFGAASLHSDERKGLSHLLEALEHLASYDRELVDQIILLVAGSENPPALRSLPFAVRYLGHLKDPRSLALAYQAADLFVSPSVHDSGPMMVLESLLCGTPIVAFPIGYAADLLPQHRIGGLAKLADARSLAKTLKELLALPRDSFQAMREQARQTAVDYCSMPVVAKRYLAFYESLR